MNKKAFDIKKIDYISGIFIVISMGILIITLYMKNHKSQPEEVKYYYTTLESTNNVSPGAGVLMLGIKVGNIKNVYLTDERKIRVDFSILEKYTKYIVKGSKLRLNAPITESLKLDTILTGSGLTLVPGDSHEKLLENTYIITEKKQGLEDLLKKYDVENILTNLSHITQNVNTITKKIADKPLTNFLFGTDTTEIHHFNSILNNLSLSLNNVNQHLPGILNQIEKSLLNINNLTSNINENVSISFNELQIIMEKLNRDMSIINNILKNINEIVEKTNNGNTVPEILEKSKKLINQSNEITYKINNMWPLKKTIENISIEEINLK